MTGADVDAASQSLTFSYDAAGNLSSVTDPLGRTSIYTHDTAGNLSKVYKLVSATGGTGVPACDLCPSAAKYETTQYIYGNPNFPHYITSIKDPRGLTPLRNLYDDQGRLYGVIDAFGKTNTFVHDLANKTETVFDRLGNPTVHGYDTRGNITQEIQYLNG